MCADGQLSTLDMKYGKGMIMQDVYDVASRMHHRSRRTASSPMTSLCVRVVIAVQIESLYGCSTLSSLRIIPSFEYCTRSAAIDACKAGICFYKTYAKDAKEICRGWLNNNCPSGALCQRAHYFLGFGRQDGRGGGRLCLM